MSCTGFLIITWVLTGESEPGNRGPILNWEPEHLGTGEPKIPSRPRRNAEPGGSPDTGKWPLESLELSQWSTFQVSGKEGDGKT